METLYLLDAYALIYRAYYAFLKTPRINSKGLNTSAIFGFLNTLQEVLRDRNPDYIAVVFDPSGKTFRHEMYEQYKAQREETPEDIRRSVPLIKQLVEAFRIPVISVNGFEADDVIGTLANKAAAAGIDTYMMTPDKDYGQLVGERKSIYRPRYGGGFETLGVQQVLDKWGIQSVTQVIDLLGLMGDASDNIPGCPGVGEKTAVKLLNEWGSIDNLLEHTDALKGALKKKIEENIEQIRFSKFLATIKTDVPIELDLASMRRSEPDKDTLVALYTELEFRKQLELLNPDAQHIPTHTRPTLKKSANPMQADLFSVPVESKGEEETSVSSADTLRTYRDIEHRYILVDTEEKLKRLSNLLEQQKEVCFDTETTGTDPLCAELVGLSFAIKSHEAWYIPVSENRDEVQSVLEQFRPIWQSPSIRKVGQNLKYDLLILENYGIKVDGPLFDTMVAHYLLNPELHHSMDYMAETLLGYRPIAIEELIGPKGKTQRNMRDVQKERITDVCNYAAEDADITWQLKDVLEKQIEKNGLSSLCYDIEMPLVRVLTRMERNGVLIDDFSLQQSSATMSAEMNRIEHAIKTMAGENINVSSPKQIGELLFEKLKLVEKPRKTRTGQYVTDEETLLSLRGKHDVIEKILQYRSLKKLLGTYVDALPKLINVKTGKIHTSFNQTITATGRLSSSNPNIQNIPIRDEQGKEIRKAFVAEPGCVFLSADYSQVELRIMAHLSKDEHLISAFQNDEDIHTATAAHIYHIPPSEVTKEMRRQAKTANFGIIYGISAFGLAERLQISRTEAKSLIDNYFNSFPGVADYIESCKEKAREKGYVETLLHRKRFLPDILSHNANVRGFAERNAVNAPIQGSAADIIKLAMVHVDQRIQREGLCSKLILQVHDELNFNVPKEEEEQMKQLVKEEMENAFPLLVPLRVDIGTGENWLEAH